MQPIYSMRIHYGIITLLFLLFSIICFLGFTRLGMFIVFDVFDEFGQPEISRVTYVDAPIAATHILTDPMEINLPKEVEQVSGIAISKDKIAVSTDQSEMFLLSLDGSTILDGGNLFPWTPLIFRQGKFEAVARFNDEFWIAGEHRSIIRVTSHGMHMGKHPLPSVLKEHEISGFTIGNHQSFFSVEGSSELFVTDQVTGVSSTLALDFSQYEELIDPKQVLLWSGIAYQRERLFIVSENYPIIVVARAEDGLVLAILGVNGLNQFSDIAVDNKRIYLSSDHNYFDPRPPLRVYDLPDEFTGAETPLNLSLETDLQSGDESSVLEESNRVPSKGKMQFSFMRSFSISRS